jgi:glycosyltransferase involved in cell wall biosynthesis
MKIIHLTSHIGHGGDWTIIRTLIEVFQEKGHQVIIGGCRASSTQFEFVEMPLNQGWKGFIHSLLKIGHLPINADIAHVHNPVALLLAVYFKYLRCPSLKIIFTYHWQTPDTQIKKKLKTSIFNLADIIHSYSTDIYETLEKEYRISKKKNFLCYVGTNPERFRERSLIEKNQLREDYCISREAFVLLFVGRLSFEKNILLVLRYLKSKRLENIILLLAGDGPLKENLQQECRNFNIEDKVHFLGRVEKIEEVYSLADLLVLPSSSMETFGMVVIEAAFCGLPTLRSDLPGAKDQISHGEDGFIFPIQQPEKMFEVLDSIWNQRDNLPKIGQKARARALEKFTLEKMYERFLDLYRN